MTNMFHPVSGIYSLRVILKLDAKGSGEAVKSVLRNLFATYWDWTAGPSARPIIFLDCVGGSEIRNQ